MLSIDIFPFLETIYRNMTIGSFGETLMIKMLLGLLIDTNKNNYELNIFFLQFIYSL